jgi:hypothetical protein
MPSGETPAPNATCDNGLTETDALGLDGAAWPAPPSELDSTITSLESRLEDWATAPGDAASKARDKTRELRFIEKAS